MLQDIYEVGTTQYYPIGMRLAKDDRVFRYALNGVRSGRSGYGLYAPMLDTETGTTPGSHAEGETVITLTAVGAPTLNQFKDGWMVIDNPIQTYRIKSSTALDGTTFTVTLYDGLAHAITLATETVNVFASMYNGTLSPEGLAGQGVAGFGSVVVVPLRNIPASNYFWGQTWGPCMVVPGDVYGDTAQYRWMGFWDDGSVADFTSGGMISPQLAGFLLPLTSIAGAPGAHNVTGLAQILMLQISP